MAHAYTPGLRVTRQATIRRERRLPLAGQVLVGVGDRVRRDQVVARTELPGDVTTLNLVNRLSVTPAEMRRYMLKKEGDQVALDEPLAATRPLVKWFKTTVLSPVAGTLESISAVTGQVILRQAPRPVEVLAYVDGSVVEVLPAEGVVVEARGAFIQGIFGVGGECWGRLLRLARSPGEQVPPEAMDAACAGRILVGGSLLTYAAIDRARQCGAVGIIGGGVHDKDLRALLGYDLGVAITGGEALGITVIVTEGFGQIDMARKTYDILVACDGREASISGATQIRAGVQRPEIVIAHQGEAEVGPARRTSGTGLQVGDQVRVIRVPHFGRLGCVSGLPPDLQQVESEARVRVLELEFESGERAVVPRANVEAIED
jgi:hypothetical protein